MLQQADAENNDPLPVFPHGGPVVLAGVNFQTSGALGTSKLSKVQYALRSKIKGKTVPMC
jgi:hypothetical protein